MGAKFGGQKVGTFGDSGMLSFCQNKIVTTGDGGAIITDSKDVFDKLKLLRSHGRDEPSNYFSTSETLDYITLGYNYRMCDILAALGSAQLSKIDEIITLRRKNAEYLSHHLSKFSQIKTPRDFGNNFNVYQLYTVLVKNRSIRNFLLKWLNENGVSTKIYFDPVHLTHFYKKVLGYNCKLPVTEELSSRVLTLPMYPSLSTDELNLIIEKIENALKTQKVEGNENGFN
jgi:perosamine synthetase